MAAMFFGHPLRRLPSGAPLGLLLLVLAAGMRPAAAPEPPRLQAPEALPGAGWRLRWTAEPGVRYRLETGPGLPPAAAWTPLATLAAEGPLLSYDDLPPAGQAVRFYRVAVAGAAADTQPPTLTGLAADPATAVQDGHVELSVTATDDTGVAAVDFFAAAALLGPGTRVEGDRWRLLWPVTFDLNGTRAVSARARDAAGNAATAAPVNVTVAIPRAGETRTVGGVTFRAGGFPPAPGGGLSPTGTVTAGFATLVAATNVVLDPAAGKLTGTGVVHLAGFGPVAAGAFVLDAASGWVTGAPPAEVAWHPLLTLAPRTLEANVLSGALRGAGVLRFALPAAAPGLQAADDTNFVAVLEGAFDFDPASHTAAFTGTATYRGVTLGGAGTVNVADAVFDLAGTLAVPGAGGSNYVLTDARLALVRPAGAEAEFTVSGRPALPALAALEVALAGTLRRSGALDLAGTGAGALDALRFTALDVRLERPALPGAPAGLRFAGPLALPRVGGTALEGRLLPDGALTNVVTTEPVSFGGLALRPRAPGEAVLRSLGSAGGRHTFAVSGLFLTPEEHGTRPVEVAGPLVLVQAGAALDVESLHLTNALPLPDWPLPDGLRVTNLTLLLTYTNPDFEARFRGQLRLLHAGPGGKRPAVLALDAALAVNVNDPADVALDAALRAEQLPLLSRAYLRGATFRLQAGSKPARGALALVNGDLGLFPRYTNEPAAPGRDDFLLFAEGVAAGFGFAGERFTAQLTNGILHLPTLFTNQPAGLCPDQRAASVRLGTDSALTFAFDPQSAPDLTLRAEGALEFRNLTFFPGDTNGLAAELCRAALAFNPGGLPYLTNLNGAVIVPLPPGQRSRVELMDGAWELDGWPSGTLALGSDVRLYEGGGMAFTLLGRGNTNCPAGTALTVLPGDGLAPRTLVIEGGIEAVLPAELVTEVAGDRARAVACGRLTLPGAAPFRPQLELLNLAFGGHYHLGGGDGLLVTNALLSLQNLDNLFELSPSRPVVVRVTGTVAVGNLPALTLDDARFTFFDPARPPRFDLAGLGYDERQFSLAQRIPARLTKASLTFDDREAGLPGLLHPTNLNLTVSGVLAFPATGDPLFETSFDDAKLDIGERGAAVFKGLDGLAMTLRGLNLPPVDDIGGRLFASGLSGLAGGARLQSPGVTQDALDLDNLFLAGRVVGSYQGYKINLIVAFRVSGMVGLCVDVNAGGAGIPLDAGYLGGVLLTGASGGMAFGTGFIDPCEFTSYLGPDGRPKPGVTALPPITLDWEDLRGKVAQALEKYDTYRKYLPGGGPALQRAAGPRLDSFLPHVRYTNDFGLPCPGDCPPPTINLFCQPHPDPERFPARVIARFSSVDEPALNRLGFTRAWVRARFAEGAGWGTNAALTLARTVRTNALAATPLPDPAALGPEAAKITDYIHDALAELERRLAQLVAARLGAAATADAAYDALRDAAYEGAPCPDLTLALSGTLTHTFVSSFLSGTVGAAVSTAGSAGVSGRVNVFGVPVGRAKGFLAATDELGDLNPALCAEAEVSVGPFELGTLRASYAIENGPAGLRRAFGLFTECLGEALFKELVRQIAPRLDVTGRTKAQLAAEMSPGEQAAFIAQLYSRPGLPAELRGCFADGLGALIADLNPELLLCGAVQPKLFSFPLGQSLFEAGMRATKAEFTGVGSFSPSLLMATVMLTASSAVGGGAVGAVAGPLAGTLFSPDEATYGISYRVADPLAPFLAGVEGRLHGPEALAGYVEEQFDAFLENATYTFAYSLSPLGFKTVDTQMRVVLPNLTAHPARPGGGWVRPESRPGQNLPSRLDLLLSALTNRLAGSSLGLLADPQWRGAAADLPLAFAPGSPGRAAVAGLSFADDYFPHGGVVGGGYVQIPRALHEAPAPELLAALNPTNSVFTRLSGAITWIQDYVLVSRQAGALGFYLPAPNPPVFTDRDGAPLTPRALLEAVRRREPGELGTPGAYPASEFFLRGWLDGQLLGVPIARADLEAALADAQAGAEGLFRARAAVPPGSWLDAFAPGARFEFELRQAPARPIQDTFQARLLTLVALRDGGAPAEAVRDALDDWQAELTNGLPRVKLEAELPLQFPAELRDLAEFTGGTWLYAYSPRYEPGFAPGDTGPRARARRDGGLAFRGHLNLRVAGRTVASVPAAELSVQPRPAGLPALAGVFDVAQLDVQALPLRNARVEFASVPAPRFAAAGTLDPVNLGVLRLESPAGGALTGRVAVVRTGPGTASVATALKPARLRLLAGTTAAVHGAAPADDFTFRTDGPWSATVDVGTSLTLAAGGVTLLDVQGAALAAPVRFDGTGTASGTLTAGINAGSTLTFFPGRPFAQTLRLGGAPQGAVVLRSDGTFEVSGTFTNEPSLSGLAGLPVGRVGAGGTFRLTPDALTLAGQLGGGVLAVAGGAGATGAGAVTVRRDGTASATGAGAFSIPPLTVGRLTVEGAVGGGLAGTLTPAGLSFSGARLRFDGLMTNALPAFAMDAQGNFRLVFGPAGAALGRFAFSSVQHELVRTNGALFLTNYAGRWQPTALGQAVELRGWLASDGRISLGGTLPAATLAGFGAGPVQLALDRQSGNLAAALDAAGPEAWWSFNEARGGTAFNRVSDKYHAPYAGAVAPGATDVAGAYAGNLSARFSGGHARLASAAVPAFPGAFSIAAWIKVNAFDRNWNTIVSKGDSAWRLQRDGARAALGFDTDGISPPYLAGTRAVDDGRWHHVAAVYDGRAKYLWVDGELDAWTPATGTVAVNAFDVLIGDNAQTGGRAWNGWLDELALYPRALTADEIIAQSRAGEGLVVSGTARLTAAGLAGVELRGTVAPGGAAAFQADAVPAQLGGFAVNGAAFRLLRGPAGPGALIFDADLAVPGIPAVRLAGSLSAAGQYDAQGALPSGQLAGFAFGDLLFRLRGTPLAAEVAASGSLSIAGLGALPFSGAVRADGNLALTNLLAGAGQLFGFPVNGWENVLRRQPADYRAVVAGDPFVVGDRGADPRAYWRLGETAGATAADSKKTSFGNPARTGAYVGGVTLGQPGGLTGPANGNPAARFDGVDDHVVIADEGAFDFSGPLSVEAWVKVGAWTREWQALVTKGDSAWRLSRFGNTRRISFETTSAAGHHSLPSSLDLDDGQWHHVAAVYDGRAKFLYVDGALDAFAPYAETLGRNDWPVMLGENAQARGRYFNGWLDEVAVYARALTPAEVTAHWVAGGGAGLAARTQLTLNGVQAVNLSGLLHPRGAASLGATPGPLGLAGFTLDGAYAGLHRVPGLGGVAQLAGRVTTPFGDATFAGTSDTLGNYTLFSAPAGTLSIGGRTFTHSSALKLTRPQIEGAGRLAFGGFGFDGAVKIPSGGGAPSFSGAATGSTSPRAFGKRLDGTPGHPYAWVNWSASAGYDAPSGTVNASVGGQLTVEYEVIEFGGTTYKTKTFGFGPLGVQADGKISLTPGEVFNGVGTFDFTLP
jgi:hypothetical protein